jgi:hypothetical protein
VKRASRSNAPIVIAIDSGIAPALHFPADNWTLPNKKPPFEGRFLHDGKG